MTTHDELRLLAEVVKHDPWLDGDVLYCDYGIYSPFADLIAAADPRTILALLDEVERLREALYDISHGPECCNLSAFLQGKARAALAQQETSDD